MSRNRARVSGRLATIQDAANLDGVGIGADKEESVFSNTQPKLFSSLKISRRRGWQHDSLLLLCGITE